MDAIKITALCKEFKGKRNTKVNALNGFDLQVSAGEVFGFLGPNGAGKSTTIKCLMGLIKPTSGTATIMGEQIGTVAARRRIGFLPENPAFYDYLSAEEYLYFVGKTFKMKDAILSQRVNDTLKLLELWGAHKRPIRGYSKGMIQRVGLAQTLIHDPDLYILDEPMSGLDPLGRALVKDLILSLKQQGKTVFFSTHITTDVEQVCDRVGIILNGELKTVENVESIMATGISGYHVSWTTVDGENLNETVSSNILGDMIQKLKSEGSEVTLIEPIRKDLEQFFLDIVKTVQY